MNVARLKIPTIVLAVVALVIGVSSGAVAAKLITSADVKNGSLKSEDIKNGTLGTKDLKQNGINGNRLAKGTVNGAKLQGGTVSGGKLQSGAVGTGQLANGSVTADKLAPGAVAFPNTLWGPMIRNQQGAAQSTLVTGPTGQPMGTGSLELSTTGAADLAAFGDSLDFAGEPLESITSLSYSSFNTAATTPRPGLRMEINPHLADDASVGGVFEFTTLTYEPATGATGWVTHANIQDDARWLLTGDEGTTIGCTPGDTVHLDRVDFTDWLTTTTRTPRRLRSAVVSTSAWVRVQRRRARRMSTSSCSTPSRSTSSPTGCSSQHPDPTHTAR